MNRSPSWSKGRKFHYLWVRLMVSGSEMLNYVEALKGTPEAKAEYFAKFAAQISSRSPTYWRATPMRGEDGSYIFVGARQVTGTNTVVISPTGQIFTGRAQTDVKLSPTGITPNYRLMRPYRK